MNKVTLIGRLGRDAEIKNTTNGTKIANFSIAISDFNHGEKTTLWVDITAFNKTAEIIEKYTHKGCLVGIDGKLQKDKYVDKNGVNREKTYIILNNIELLSPKEDNNQELKDDNTQEETSSDEDIPF